MEALLIEICANCKHHHVFEETSEYVQCRRFPPLPIADGDQDDEFVWAFPVVFPHSWCGEFKEK